MSIAKASTAVEVELPNPSRAITPGSHMTGLDGVGGLEEVILVFWAELQKLPAFSRSNLAGGWPFPNLDGDFD